MPSQAAMKATLQSYLDYFNEGDAEKLTSLFAADATVGRPGRRTTARAPTSAHSMSMR